VLRNRISGDVAAICQESVVRQKLEAAGHNVLSGRTEELKMALAKQRTWIAEINKIIDIRNAQ